MLFSATLFFSTVIAACLAQSNHEPIKAVAVFSGMSNVAGSIHFVQDSPQSPTTIFANMTGLSAGEHGLHIHEFGDLTNGCASNGPHYNPWNKTHGGPQSDERHAGDFGNIVADAQGNAFLRLTSDTVYLSGPYSVIGRGIVIHADKDDLGLGGSPLSNTTGNSGDRLACGIIGYSST